MSDKLKDLEEKLGKYKHEYDTILKYITSIASECGEDITECEQEQLDGIASLIEEVDTEINRRKELLSGATTMAKVRAAYGITNSKFDVLFKEVRLTYSIWHQHILEVGKAYTLAYGDHAKIVKEQEKHETNINNIGNSILSLAGMGLFSWISDMGLLVKHVKSLSTGAADVLEDVAQGTWDKAVSLGAIKVDESFSGDIGSAPLVFQNEFHSKSLAGYIEVQRILLKVSKECVSSASAIHNMNMRGEGNPKEEYDIYLAYEASVKKVISSIEKWMNHQPPSTDYVELRKDFERQFWAKWLPGLHQHFPARQEYSADHGLGTVPRKIPASDSYDNWWLSRSLKNRLTTLIELERTCMQDSDGLRHWVSENDIKCLVEWAKDFHIEEKF